jgi:hypothetical protein
VILLEINKLLPYAKPASIIIPAAAMPAEALML